MNSTTISNLAIQEIITIGTEDFQKDETDYPECRNVEKDKAAHYESLLSSRNNHEYQDPNITDPFLAHELKKFELGAREATTVLQRFLFLLRDFRRFISDQTRRNHGDLIACFPFFTIALFTFLRLLPYNRMPKPRLFCANGEDAECILPKRPPSPVRHILPGRFDLHARTEELLKRRGIAKARRYLWEFKARISQSVKQVWDADVDLDLVICTLVLQALCENVILTMAGTNIEIDIHAFVNMVVSWTLVDLQILDPVMLDEQERTMFIEMEVDIDRSATSREMVVSSKLRRALFEHRPKFDLHISMHLHRSLPWSLVSPAHQTGIVKFYPNVREQIDEMLQDSFQHIKSVFIPDVTCCHFREMLEITSLYGLKEKSKSV